MEKIIFVGIEVYQTMITLSRDLQESSLLDEEACQYIYEQLMGNRDFLIDNSPIYKLPGCNRQIMIAAVLAGYYEYASYRTKDYHYEVEDKEILLFLDNPQITAKQAIQYFMQNPHYAQHIIKVFMEYASKPDRIVPQCLKYLKDTNRLKQVLRINPFLWQRYEGVFKEDFLLESDSITNNILEIYDSVVEQRQYDDNPSTDIYTDLYKEFCHFLDLELLYDNKEGQVGYILGNILENIQYRSTNRELQADEKFLLQLLSSNAPQTVIHQFLENSNLGRIVLENFVIYNQKTSNELNFRKRQIVTKRGNPELVKKYNPFYSLEDRRRKEISN